MELMYYFCPINTSNVGLYQTSEGQQSQLSDTSSKKCEICSKCVRLCHTTNYAKLPISAHSACSDCLEPLLSLVPRRVENENMLLLKGVSAYVGFQERTRERHLNYRWT